MDVDSIIFWAIGLVAALASGAMLLRPLQRGADTSDTTPDVSVYRDQLAEIDSDLSRQVISEEDAVALRVEVKRRLLAAADRSAGTTGSGAAAPAAILTAVALLAGLGLYGWVGEPGRSDRPLASRIAEAETEQADRPSQSDAEAHFAANAPDQTIAADPEHLALITQLETLLAEKPDPRGQRLLAQSLARVGRYAEARAAQQVALSSTGAEVTTEDMLNLAEYMIFAANGYVSPEAEEALDFVMQREPGNLRARYYAGLFASQAGRPDIAWDLWTRILRESPPDAPWAGWIRGQLPDLAAALGRDLPGPDAEDVEAASQMSPEDRAAMIEGMVSGLAQRLAEDGGPAEDWARLIRARAVQGKTELAQEIWREAKAVFADDDAALSLINQTADDAGLSE